MAKELDFVDGQLVEVVKSTRGLELTELENDVAQDQAVLDETLARKRQEFEGNLANDPEVVEATAKLENSKSTLERGQELVGSSAAAGVDLGTDGTGGEAEAGVPEESVDQVVSF